MRTRRSNARSRSVSCSLLYKLASTGDPSSAFCDFFVHRSAGIIFVARKAPSKSSFPNVESSFPGSFVHTTRPCNARAYKKSKREPSGEEGLRKLREKRRSESKAEPRGRTLVKSIGGPPPTEASSPSAAAVLCISSRILMSVPGLMACADRHKLATLPDGTRGHEVERSRAASPGCIRRRLQRINLS